MSCRHVFIAYSDRPVSEPGQIGIHYIMCQVPMYINFTFVILKHFIVACGALACAWFVLLALFIFCKYVVR